MQIQKTATNENISESVSHPSKISKKKFSEVKRYGASDLERLMDDLSFEESDASILPPSLAVPLPNEPRPIRTLTSPEALEDYPS